MRKARFWTKHENGTVKCLLCPHNCTIKEDSVGICGVRKNIEGTLYSLVWGKAVAASIDPIEKKPLFHVLPGSHSFSIATVGCNMKCAFCQNSDISQYPHFNDTIPGEDLSPEKVVSEALANNCSSISYTYTEPTIFLEYVLDTAKLAKQEGLLNTMITNGYISPDIIKSDLKSFIDAANIDLKSFRDNFYRTLCSARLEPVLDAIRTYHEAGIWIEITTLLIPGENDSPEEIRDIATFIRSINPDIPWHISRYYPRYRYDKAPPTPVKAIEAAREVGLNKGLRYVYTGNTPGHTGENTYCHSCGALIIPRNGYSVRQTAMNTERCFHCNNIIPGRFR